MRGGMASALLVLLAPAVVGGIPASDDATFTVTWDHATGALRIQPGATTEDDDFARAGCIGASAGEQWAMEPPGVGACAHAWMFWPLGTTLAACSVMTGCFVDAINWDEDGFDYIVLECVGAGGGAMPWGGAQAVAPTCETRAQGEPPSTWTKWDSQILSYGGMTSVVHVMA